jgi:hypothetical protein
MKCFPALIIAFLLSGYSWAEPPSTDGAYKQPYPHSNGAALLLYCEKAGEVVSQLRCDYYVQGVADLATMPQQGQPMACIPQGQVKPDTLERESAASLILQGFRATFPCSAEDAAVASKTGEPAPVSKATAEAIYKAMLEANQKTGSKAPD